MKLRYVLAVVSLGLALLSVPSSAMEPVTPGWTSLQFNLSFEGSGLKLDQSGTSYPAEVLYSGDETTAGNVAFSCFAGRYAVTVGVDPVNMAEFALNPPDSRRMKIRTPQLIIGGEPIRSRQWLYMPRGKVYRARKRLPASQIYNAILRGQTVSMKANGGHIALNLPPVDDAFKNFGSECGLGRNAKR